jgi:hypothetical protein
MAPNGAEHRILDRRLDAGQKKRPSRGASPRRAGSATQVSDNCPDPSEKEKTAGSNQNSDHLINPEGCRPPTQSRCFPERPRCGMGSMDPIKRSWVYEASAGASQNAGPALSRKTPLWDGPSRDLETRVAHRL